MSRGQAGIKLGTTRWLSPAGAHPSGLSTVAAAAGDDRPPLVPVAKARGASVQPTCPGIHRLYDYDEV